MAGGSSSSDAPRFRLIFMLRLSPYRMSFAAFLIAQYYSTPLSHSRERLRVCF